MFNIVQTEDGLAAVLGHGEHLFFPYNVLLEVLGDTWKNANCPTQLNSILLMVTLVLTYAEIAHTLAHHLGETASIGFLIIPLPPVATLPFCWCQEYVGSTLFLYEILVGNRLSQKQEVGCILFV